MLSEKEVKEINEMTLENCNDMYENCEKRIIDATSEEEIEHLKEYVTEMNASRRELTEIAIRREVTKNLNGGESIDSIIMKRNIGLHSAGAKEIRLMSKEFRNYLKNGELAPELRANTLSNTGALLPETIFDQFLKTGGSDNSALLDKITVSNLKHSGYIQIPVITSTDAGWHEENKVTDPEAREITNIELKGYELMKLMSVSAAAYSMTDERFDAYFADLLIDEMGNTIEKAIINGTGNGQPTGILTGIEWKDGENCVETAADITVDDIISGVALLPTRYKKNAVIIGNRDMIYNKVRKLKDSNERYIMDIDGANATILGVPVVIAEDMPNDTLILGDLSKYFLNFAQPIEVERSKESGFRKASIDIRALAVLDGKPFAPAFVKVAKAE